MLDEAIDFNLALGPAAEAVRLAEGVIANSSVWIVTARASD